MSYLTKRQSHVNLDYAAHPTHQPEQISPVSNRLIPVVSQSHSRQPCSSQLYLHWRCIPISVYLHQFYSHNFDLSPACTARRSALALAQFTTSLISCQSSLRFFWRSLRLSTTWYSSYI